MPHHCLREAESPVTESRFDALAVRLLEGLGIREVGAVGTTLDVKDSPEDIEVRRLELDIMRCAEGPRRTAAQ